MPARSGPSDLTYPGSAPRAWRSWAAVLALGAGAACDSLSALSVDYRDPLIREGDGRRAGDGRAVPPGDASGRGDTGGRGGDGGGAGDSDRCTEAATGSACALNGVTGNLRCIKGHTRCTECQPGDLRQTPCGECSFERSDSCSDTGLWLNGVCDGCADSKPNSTCNAADSCKPGEREWRRCDICPDPATCGAECIGSEYLCSAGCEWVEVADCQVYAPKCSADDVLIEPCNACGWRQDVCDGCFWVKPPCKDQGECKPGDTRVLPCTDNDCLAGMTTTMTCGTDCKWLPATPCSGCPASGAVITTGCFGGAHPECGSIVTQYTCTFAQVSICGGDET
jgi:hypothetical protein